MSVQQRHGVVQFCHPAKVPKCISTGEENNVKAGFGFLHMGSVDISGWAALRTK